MDMNMEPEPQITFKARPVNQKIFTREPSFPKIEKKNTTSFNEFKLSQPKSRDISMEIERQSTDFKARSLNRKILKEADFKPVVDTKKLTQQSPFNLRLANRRQSVPP